MNQLNVVKRCAFAAGNAVKDVAQKAADMVGRPVVVGLTGLAIAGSSHAAPGDPFTFDSTPIVAAIGNGVTAISAIGVAVISLVVVIKLYKWVQRVL